MAEINAINHYVDPNEAYQSLAYGTVAQAVDDFKQFKNGKATETPGFNEYEIINFFRSSWCGTLLHGINRTGRELENALVARYG